eukprot:TRINITY_DN65577_c0_g1_i1.p2 TRINITY_DN65577_c0_g1~~TRINITY_DN65577_c0_g1_i1.p2  ORF type:complete len:147 (+),score=66.33 TRINITY_DN65577_c0_g1_i1:314-754(+)
MFRLRNVLLGCTRLLSPDTICAGVPRCEVFEGRWKYVLLEVTGGGLAEGAKDHAVTQCPCEKCDDLPQACDRSCFHKQLAKPYVDRITGGGQKVWMDGGGWIEVDCLNKTMHVYGVSIAMGPAPHIVTAAKLRESFPDYAVTYEEE